MGIIRELISIDGISEADVVEVLDELGDLDDDIDSQVVHVLFMAFYIDRNIYIQSK